MTIDTKKLKEAADAATPGPWDVFGEALMLAVMAGSRCICGHVTKSTGHDP